MKHTKKDRLVYDLLLLLDHSATTTQVAKEIRAKMTALLEQTDLQLLKDIKWVKY